LHHCRLKRGDRKIIKIQKNKIKLSGVPKIRKRPFFAFKVHFEGSDVLGWPSHSVVWGRGPFQGAHKNKKNPKKLKGHYLGYLKTEKTRYATQRTIRFDDDSHPPTTTSTTFRQIATISSNCNYYVLDKSTTLFYDDSHPPTRTSTTFRCAR
jgi:hypothetical protein